MKNRNASSGNFRLEKARQLWHFLRTQEAFRRAPVLTLSRSAIWYCRCFLQLATALNLTRWNVWMSFRPSEKDSGSSSMPFANITSPELAYLEEVLSQGKVFVDVGANFGVYTLVASRLVGATGKVIALEPTAQSFETLRQNIALNHFSNVRAFQVALTQSSGKAWLYHGWDPVSNSLGKDPLSGDEAKKSKRNRSTISLRIRHRPHRRY